jgi:hypothetical protein
MRSLVRGQPARHPVPEPVAPDPRARVTDEPLRSLFAPDDMRALVERFGFAVTSDESLPVVARRLSDDVRGVGWAVESQRVVVADR